MKKTLLTMLIVSVLAISILTISVLAEYPTPEVDEIAVQNFVESVGVQIRIPIVITYRSLTWYKYDEGIKLTQKEIDKLSDDEKEWYGLGYKVEYGEWQSEDDEKVESAIYGSGVVIYSAILPEPLQSQEKGIYGATLFMTNYHVGQPIIDKLSLGSRFKPFNVYEEIDTIKSIYPPSVKIRKGARPTKQKFFTLGHIKEEYKATKNTAEIKRTEDQNYQINAKIVAYDKGLDVCVMQVDNVFFQPYATFRGTPCQVGERIWSRDAPLALPFSTNRGWINQVGLDLGIWADGLGWNDQVKTDIPSAPGSSGAGIFDVNGFLIAQHHGVLVNQGNYIVGGHLANAGDKIAEWLSWNGFSYIFLEKPYKTQQDFLEKIHTMEEIE